MVRDRRHYHQGSHSVKKQYYIIIGGLLVYITLFRLILPLRFFTSQILLRVLYLIPIIYAGLSKGKKGGVLVSVIVSLLLLPHFFSDQVVHSLFHKENVAAIITFLIVGFLSGAYRDTLEEQYVKTTTQVHRHATFGKKFLIYLDQTPLSLQTIDWFIDSFGVHDDVHVALLCVIEGKKAAHLRNGEAEVDAKELNEQAAIRLSQSRERLMEGGMSEDRIHPIIATAEALPARPITDRILNELRSGKYDTVLVPKHNTNKTQEFLLGDVAALLLRESPVPVVAVKMKVDSGEHEDADPAG